MRHISRRARDLKRAQAHNRASHGPHIAITRETTTNKRGFEGKIMKTNDVAKDISQWQAAMASVGPNNPKIQQRPCAGNVAELLPEPRQSKDRTYQHGPLQQPSHLWADTVTASDKDITKGRRYQTKRNF